MPVKGLLSFNPVQEVNQLLIFIFISLALAGAWKYRNRVIFLFTGDDRLHFGYLDMIWFWCCRCGGCCDGEWTRSLTCFGGSYNIKQEFGRWLGVVSRPIEIRNIVTGDLPFSG